jgi:hypothetical protein
MLVAQSAYGIDLEEEVAVKAAPVQAKRGRENQTRLSSWTQQKKKKKKDRLRSAKPMLHQPCLLHAPNRSAVRQMIHFN